MDASDILALQRRRTSVSDLVSKACATWNVPRQHLLGRPRYASVAEARHAVCAVAYESGLYSLPQLGRIIGRDHTSVLHGIRKMNAATDPELLAKLEALRR